MLDIEQVGGKCEGIFEVYIEEIVELVVGVWGEFCWEVEDGLGFVGRFWFGLGYFLWQQWR